MASPSSSTSRACCGSSRSKLIGRPWQLAPNGGHDADGLDEVRSFFTRYDDLLDQRPAATVDLAQLRADIASAHRTFQADRYEAVIGQIARMLEGVDRAHRSMRTGQVPELSLGYVSAYVVAAKLLTKLGASDLALTRISTQPVRGKVQAIW